MSAGEICFPSEIARRVIEDAVSNPAGIASNIRTYYSYLKIIATYRIQITRQQDTSVPSYSSTRIKNLRTPYLPWSVHEMDDGSQNPHHKHIVVLPTIEHVYIVRSLIFAVCKTTCAPFGSLNIVSQRWWQRRCGKAHIYQLTLSNYSPQDETVGQSDDKKKRAADGGTYNTWCQSADLAGRKEDNKPTIAPTVPTPSILS